MAAWGWPINLCLHAPTALGAAGAPAQHASPAVLFLGGRGRQLQLRRFFQARCLSVPALLLVSMVAPALRGRAYHTRLNSQQNMK